MRRIVTANQPATVPPRDEMMDRKKCCSAAAAGDVMLFGLRRCAVTFSQASDRAPAQCSPPTFNFKGKTVRITGTVRLYREKLQIKVEDREPIKDRGEEVRRASCLTGASA